MKGDRGFAERWRLGRSRAGRGRRQPEL